MRVPVGGGIFPVFADLGLDDIVQALAHLHPVPRMGIVSESFAGLSEFGKPIARLQVLETLDVLTELRP